MNDEDKIHLENYSNFEILMSIIKQQNKTMQRNRVCVTMVLSLLFPEYEILITKDAFVLKHMNGQEEQHEINNKNYDIFLNILNEIFCLNASGEATGNYNPKGNAAKRIADKLKRGRTKVGEAKNQKNKVAIISRYVSILTVGEQKDMNDFMGYTVYQLFDEFKRYDLKMAWDHYIQASLAGAKDLKEVDDWMKDIHSEE